MKPPTVRSLTDSILSIYGDVDQPNVWAQYVSATERTFGSTPTGCAHSREVSATWETYWLVRFGILSPTREELAMREERSREGCGLASGMFCAP